MTRGRTFRPGRKPRNPGALGEIPQQARGSRAGLGVRPVGRKLRQRRKDESALDQPRVGQDRVPRTAPLPAQIQDVDVDLPGAVAKAGRTADGLLDALRGAQQRGGRAAPEDRRDRVPEMRLGGEADGFGAVKGGDAEDRGNTGDLGERMLEPGFSIAAIGAQSEVGDLRGAVAPGISRLRLPLRRPREALRPLRARRRRDRSPPAPPAPLPRTRADFRRGWFR
jgi:hypothetical protein